MKKTTEAVEGYLPICDISNLSIKDYFRIIEEEEYSQIYQLISEQKNFLFVVDLNGGEYNIAPKKGWLCVTGNLHQLKQLTTGK